MSSYDPFHEKLPSISMLNQHGHDNNSYNQDLTFTNFAPNSDLYLSDASNNSTNDMSIDLYHQQHLSPPLTPAVSPSNMDDPAQFKRKYSVDVGPFGYNAHLSSMHDQQDGYRRSSYSSMSEHHGHSLQQEIIHHQQSNYYQQPVHHNNNNSYLIGDSSSTMTMINSDTMKSSKRTRLGQQYQQGPSATHKHVCKYSECGWSFKRYEHLKRHMLVHTGERPHVCTFPGCGKSFSRSDNFHAHYRTHTKRQSGGGDDDDDDGGQSHTTRRDSKNSGSPSNGDVYLPMTTSPSTSSSSSSAQQDLIHGYPPSQSFVYNNTNTNNNNKPFEMSYQDMYDQRSFTSEAHEQYSSMASPQPYMRMGLSSQVGVSSLLNHDQTTSMFSSHAMTSIYDLQGDYTGFHSTTGIPPSSSSPPTSSPSTLIGLGSTSNDFNKKQQRKYRSTLSHTNNNGSETMDSGMQQKSHVCPMTQCQRRFKRLEHLKRHMRIHTLERPFACTFLNCHKHFSRSDNLSQHMKTHQHRPGQDKRRKSSTTTIGSSPSPSSSVSPHSFMDDFTSTTTSTDSHSTNTMSALPSCWTLSESVGC